MKDLATWLTETEQDLAGLVSGVEPGRFDASALPALAERLERVMRQVGVLRDRVAEDTVRREAWRATGSRSAEAWFARVTGASQVAAARRLSTQERLRHQPVVREARDRGVLSEEQAVQVTEAAQHDPEAQERLVRQAQRGSHRQLREECDRTIAATRRAEDDERRRRALHAGRCCRTWVDSGGAGRVEASLTPEALARFRACLEPFARAEFDQARRQGRRESHEAYQADALVAMAQAAGSDRSAERRTTPATVIALVSHQALQRGSVEPGETCTLDGIGPVAVSVVQEMMSDAFLATVVTDGVDIRAVAHPGRQVTAAMRTALVARDPCCVVPGCGAREGLEIDHVTGWAVTHLTRLDDLARLCRRHHRLKTTGGWRLRGPPGRWQWTGPGTSDDHDDGPLGGEPPPSGQDRLFAAGADPPRAA